MKEITNNEPCCEKNSTDTSCSCSCSLGGDDRGKSVRRKAPKMVICLVVLLAAVSIVAFKVTTTSGSSSDAAAFDFGKAASAFMSSEGNNTQAKLNFGEYLGSFSELNTVAINNDVVFVFIPASGNDLIDDTTRAAVVEAQQILINNNNTVGLYTLSHDSTDYSRFANQVELPVIFVARKGASAALAPARNVSANTLLQSYLACCDTSSGCCP